MKVLIINSVYGSGSTGRICQEIENHYISKGCTVKVAYGREELVPEKYRVGAIKIGGRINSIIHVALTRLFDFTGYGSYFATKKFLKWAEDYHPDLLWLHLLHGYYINIKLLFKWIKKHPDMEVKWTMHDCWAFTGHCVHFTIAKCDKWKNGCSHCPQKKVYPNSYLLDNSKRNYKTKKALFCGVNNLTIVTPSEWLANLVRQSFLKNYPIEVMYNPVNHDIFCPIESSFRKDNLIEDKYMVLGVANGWGPRKGLNEFMKLAEVLDDSYQIVLVGLTKKQIEAMPRNIICIEHTDSPRELAQIYTAADVFVNPSREETFGMTTVEAGYCGTPGIVYKNTACEEIAEKFGGVAVDQSFDAILREIEKMKSRKSK